MVFPTTAATEAATPVASVASGSMVSNVFTTAFSLVLVLVVIFAIAWLMRWMQRARIVSSSSLRINGGIQVGARERVLIVQAGDKHLLIGVAPGRVQTLHVFDQAPVITGDSVQEISPFAERLRQLIQPKPPS